MSDTPSFIFGRCPECIRSSRPDLHAKLVSKFPASDELTQEQAALMRKQADEYVQDFWNMCRAHRRKLRVSAFRLPGEAKLEPAILLDLGQIRHGTCWVMDIYCTKPDRDGHMTVKTEIYRAEDGCTGIH